MEYDNPFAEEVRHNPYDDVPRLIFADFLDDHGDPLGQLIRAQVSLAGLKPDDPQRTPFEKQEQALIEAYGDQWLEPLRTLGAEGISHRCFQRGLIERIRISAENFLLNGEVICLQCPALHTLTLTNLDAAFRKFNTAVLPKQIRGLDLSLCSLDTLEASDRHWELMDCIEQLRDLDLHLTKATEASITQLCTRNLTNLQRLDLSACGLTSACPVVLAGCASLSNLRTLKFSLNRIEDFGLQAIARGPVFSELRTLDVAHNGITNVGADELANSRTLVSLEQLNLRANRIQDPQFIHLGAYQFMPNLQSVDLRNNR